MERYLMSRQDGQLHLRVPFRGAHLLRQPLFNKGTAFTRGERAAFALDGLLPDAVSTMEQQARRAYDNIVRKDETLERYVGLAALQDRNEHLFYRLLADHLEEFLPVVYAPTVGHACQEFSHIFRRGRGLWITPGHVGRMEDVLANAPHPDVRLVVVTDNERVLGLGDQGAGGMALPVGKAALYTAVAGIHPVHVLPVSLDVGTDNTALLDDDLYLGWRAPRLRGAEYDALVDEFVHAVRRRFPHAIVQWEDLRPSGAFRLLDRYRRVLPSFNDDIQGTAAVVLAGLRAGIRIAGGSAPLRVVIAGAGAAGIGVARLLRDTLLQEGRSADEVTESIALVDRQGLVLEDRPATGLYKRDFAWPKRLAARHGLGGEPPAALAEVVRRIRPTALIGATGCRGLFSEDVVRAMAAGADRPIVFALSSPETRSEAHPKDLLAWTQGRALIASGSDFAPFLFEGSLRTVSHATTALVFPAIALGAIVAKAYEVTNGMLRAAAEQLAAEVDVEERAAGRLFPSVSRLREITPRIAEAVVRAARDSGVGLPLDDGVVARAVAGMRWEPTYPLLDPAPDTSAAGEAVSAVSRAV